MLGSIVEVHKPRVFVLRHIAIPYIPAPMLDCFPQYRTSCIPLMGNLSSWDGLRTLQISELTIIIIDIVHTIIRKNSAPALQVSKRREKKTCNATHKSGWLLKKIP